MMRKIKFVFLDLFAAAVAAPAMAAEPLVDAGWVKNNLGKPGIVFLDVTSNPAAYAKGHVPGAVSGIDIDGILARLA